MKKGSLIQSISELLFAFLLIIMLFERYWDSSNLGFYTFTGILGAVLIAAAVIYRSLYKELDVQLIFLFFFFVFVSITVNYGFSGSPRVLRYFCLWAGVFSLYFIVQAAPDRKRLMRVFSAVSVLPLGYMCISVLLNASHSLCKEVPPMDTLKGCFEQGRLCGLNNANYMGFICVALILIAVYGLLRARKWFRLYYAAAILLGWFTLGLTNSRTCMIGASFAAGLLFAIIVHRKYLKGHPALKWILSIIILLAVTVLLVQTFYLPVRIYRLAGELYGKWKNNTFLLNNLSALSDRWIIDDDGTFADRLNIWMHSLKSTFSSPRRLLFGVSQIRYINVDSIYEGHHEVFTPHAHNIFIEILRLYGIIGFAIWSAMVAAWIYAWAKVLSAQDQELSDMFLATACAGMLLMGGAEPMPLLAHSLVQLSIPFVVMSGSLINKRRCENE